MDKNKRIKDIDKLIEKNRQLIGLLQRSEKRIGKKADFTITGHLGRNMLGDLIRKQKLSLINQELDRIQEELLIFHKDLLLFDENIARRIDLPYKLQEFSLVRDPLSDIFLRSQMRSKKLQVQKIKNRLYTVLKKLVFEKKKVIYQVKKETEFRKFEEENIN